MPVNFDTPDIDWTFYISDPAGKSLPLIAGYEVFSAKISLASSNVGVLTMRLAVSFADYFTRDTNIKVNRRSGQTTSVIGKTLFKVRFIRFETDDSGQEFLLITAFSLLSLIAAHDALAAAGTSLARKTSQAADNMAKAIINEHCITHVDTRRNIPLLTVDTNLTAAAVIPDKAYSNENILQLCQEICQISAQNGVYMAIDIELIASNYVFKTYTGARGVNRGFNSSKSLTLTAEGGNLLNPSVTFDYTEEVTFALAGGQGEGDQRIYKPALASATVRNASPYNWRESFVDARNEDTPSAVQGAADKRIREGRPKVIFSATYKNGRYIFGVDFDFGDVVICKAFNRYQFECRVDKVDFTFDKSGEQIDLSFNTVADL